MGMLSLALVGWVERSSPDGVQFYVALWKPNDVQNPMRGALPNTFRRTKKQKKWTGLSRSLFSRLILRYSLS